MFKAEASKVKRFVSRILILISSVLSLILLAVAYAYYIEPAWLRVTHVRLSDHPTVRLIHMTDIHHKGDAAYLKRVVKRINGLDADAVCFTGDLVEDAEYLPEALEILSGLNKPLYGIPGNHDYWAQVQFGACSNAFRKTGGLWLASDQEPLPPDRVKGKRILLSHYPYGMNGEDGASYDLILSGHTHGGQVRPAALRNAFVPLNMGKFDAGLFRTPKGPLYINTGIGTFFVHMRFLCRPEITVIEL